MVLPSGLDSSRGVPSFGMSNQSQLLDDNTVSDATSPPRTQKYLGGESQGAAHNSDWIESPWQDSDDPFFDDAHRIKNLQLAPEDDVPVQQPSAFLDNAYRGPSDSSAFDDIPDIDWILWTNGDNFTPGFTANSANKPFPDLESPSPVINQLIAIPQLAPASATNGRTHNRNNRISCTHPGCSATFARAGDFRRHMKNHGPPEFGCPISRCPKEFSRLDKLRDHMRQGHKMTSAEVNAHFIRVQRG